MSEKNTEQFEKTLRRVRRARTRLFVCFWTFPVYVVTVMRTLDAGQETTMIMLAYMVLYAAFGISVAVKRCPECQHQFFVKTFFLNPFRRKCVHCGLALNQK
jgi:hypothetical protein